MTAVIVAAIQSNAASFAIDGANSDMSARAVKVTASPSNVDLMRRAFVRLLGITPRAYRELRHGGVGGNGEDL
jgi:hypothetical protein